MGSSGTKDRDDFIGLFPQEGHFQCELRSIRAIRNMMVRKPYGPPRIKCPIRNESGHFCFGGNLSFEQVPSFSETSFNIRSNPTISFYKRTMREIEEYVIGFDEHRILHELLLYGINEIRPIVWSRRRVSNKMNEPGGPCEQSM